MSWKAQIQASFHVPTTLIDRLGFDRLFVDTMINKYFYGYDNYAIYKQNIIKYIESLSDVEILLLTGGRTWHLKQETE